MHITTEHQICSINDLRICACEKDSEILLEGKDKENQKGKRKNKDIKLNLTLLRFLFVNLSVPCNLLKMYS